MGHELYKVLLTLVGMVVLVAITGLAYVKLAMPNVGPAPVMTISPTKARIDHGRYLANHVALCVSCHSTRDFSKLTGPLVASTEGKGAKVFSGNRDSPATSTRPTSPPITSATGPMVRSTGPLPRGSAAMDTRCFQSCPTGISLRCNPTISGILLLTFDRYRPSGTMYPRRNPTFR